MKFQFKQYELFLFSTMLLLIGSLYYLLFRQPTMASSLFGFEFLHLNLFASVFNSFPSFVHQLAFVLLTWLALNKKHKWFALLFWLTINSLFEIGQLLSTENIFYLPQLLENYFVNGSYNHGDMTAIFFATFVAYIIINNQKETQCLHS